MSAWILVVVTNVQNEGEEVSLTIQVATKGLDGDEISGSTNGFVDPSQTELELLGAIRQMGRQYVVDFGGPVITDENIRVFGGPTTLGL